MALTLALALSGCMTMTSARLAAEARRAAAPAPWETGAGGTRIVRAEEGRGPLALWRQQGASLRLRDAQGRCQGRVRLGAQGWQADACDAAMRCQGHVTETALHLRCGGVDATLELLPEGIGWDLVSGERWVAGYRVTGDAGGVIAVAAHRPSRMSLGRSAAWPSIVSWPPGVPAARWLWAQLAPSVDHPAGTGHRATDVRVRALGPREVLVQRRRPERTMRWTGAHLDPAAVALAECLLGPCALFAEDHTKLAAGLAYYMLAQRERALRLQAALARVPLGGAGVLPPWVCLPQAGAR